MRRKEDNDERLGMFRRITRRDFLQGTALGIGGARWARGQSPDIPPSGFQGQDPDATERGHRVRDQTFRTLPSEIADTGERYDLVVVGAGLAGLAAAYVYRKEEPTARVLLLENNDDFGGHARRNTFRWNGTTLIVNGGTYDLESPEHSPPEALEILSDLGIDFDRLVGFRDPDFRRRLGLSSSCLFDSRIYSGIRSQWVNGFHEKRWEEFFAAAPVADSVKRELVELYTTRTNYLAGVDDVHAVLAKMSWEDYIRKTMGLGDEAVRFSDLYATDLGGLGCDALPATYGFELGPGFFGVGGEGFYDDAGFLRYGYNPIHRFPDGNRSLARHLVKKLMPESLTGEDTMEGVFNGRLHYDRLDRPSDDVRLRLRATVVRVEHLDGGSRVAVYYATPDGRVHRVTADGAVVAAWGMAAKHIVPGLSASQRDALEGYHYASALYINVLLRHWRPLADTGAFEMYTPGGYATWMHVLDPLHVGDYRPRHHPDAPTVLSMFKYLRKPGLPAAEQMKLARYELEAKPFTELEREIRTELDRLFAPFGFDASEDIAALTVNRWGHGYIVFPEAQDRRGREPVGRISFAGADAGGSPWTQAAFREGHRAAHEQLG